MRQKVRLLAALASLNKLKKKKMKINGFKNLQKKDENEWVQQSPKKR
jgi:hypothetical protein